MNEDAKTTIPEIDPEALEAMKTSVCRFSDTVWAAYENSDLGHSQLGHLKFMAVGSENTFKVAPVRLPDTADGAINWRYIYVGTVNLETGEVDRKRPAGLSIYEQMKAAGVEIDHHESDLYVPANEKTRAIIDGYEYKCSVTMFRSDIDGTPWYDIPFSYDPFWTNK